MERAAELVQLASVPAHERVALLVGQLDAGERPARVSAESVAEGRVLLQAIEDDVRLVAPHVTFHSSAARPTRPISPKKRTRARAGLTAPSRNSQLSRSC